MRAAWVAKAAGMELPEGAGLVNAAPLPQLSRRARSASSSTSIDDNRATGSAVIAAIVFASRSSSASILAASNTSVRNSTAPPIPAGAPASVNCSANENAKSIRAVWVSTGIGVTCRSPKTKPEAGLSPCPAKFCQATITWTRG
ncbi:hypothetical protein LAUMK7_05720 [Mycobacterium kansasii]|nr:hypothetical protein LAUMK22_05720 [Mycobacterium kansasii]VAZ69781.1 hypothetical protein LAUMK40_05944 [Mycobacterium kansasii]VAZ81153.1 hypothetical protein LAUMK7_05720 [Mycobacterium kansasii]